MRLPQLTITDLSRSGHVTRWHSVNTTRKQTLAEHHHLVERFSVHLARIIIKDDLVVETLFAMSEYASVHDFTELLLGDTPSPAKRHMEQICGGESPIAKIENEIAPWIKTMKDDLKEKAPELLLIVKLADLIDALLFISTEGVGKHAEKVVGILDTALKAKLSEAQEKFPQFDWQQVVVFINELLESEGDTQIEFEAGLNGVEEGNARFSRLFGHAGWQLGKPDDKKTSETFPKRKFRMTTVLVFLAGVGLTVMGFLYAVNNPSLSQFLHLGA